jgi:rhamnogalacturonyl hydrolase YesR
MESYFEDHQSMFAHAGAQVEKTLDAITRRYRGQNPAHPPTYRAYQQRGIMRGPDYRYHADFNREFPAAADGTYVYAWARIWAEAASSIKFDLTCHSPVVLYCNQQSIYRSTIFEERYPDARHSLQIALQPGWNHLVLRFKKTCGGFGGVFGTWLGKLAYYFLMPTDERAGQEGWVFSEPQAAELTVIPGAGVTEVSSGLVWQPRQEWTKGQRAQGQCRRIFGVVPKACAVGWTQGLFLRAGAGKYSLRGRCAAPITVTIADQVVFATRKAGAFDASVSVPFGRHDIMVQAECTGADWGFDLNLRDGTELVALASPCNLQGPPLPWIFAGPLPLDPAPDLARLRNLRQLVPAIGGDTFWRLDAPDMWVRIYNDNALFGHWNYPLGVTVYGLLHSARALGSDEMQRYLVEHVQSSCDLFPYALWDKRQFGGATNVHHLLTSIDSLDDCGSFGSCLLEMGKYFKLQGLREIADYVADYISTQQIRLPDGTFFRKNLMHTFHEDTLWADDLYMSVPFLCRYYELTGEARYVDDAARQFLGFKKLLFIPKLKAMSHVYDFTRNLATGVPWGRGNGWVIFSLSELLAVLPADHALRPELLAMFRELCAGYLALQDDNGMWHQVLHEPDSYLETSCTSMFAYAFARGVQYGWLETPAPYVRSVFKAWEALNRVSIDRLGNVHGVCRGSEFSFTSEYYKKDLLWNLNDTHGIGIVLLAGVEVIRLTKHLQKTGAPAAVTGSAPKRTAARKPRRALAAAK